MKKQLTFLVLVFLVMPLVNIFSQDEPPTVGLAQTYTDQAQEYFQQEKEMSKQQEEKILKNMSAETKSKLEEIKKYDKNKYYKLLRNQNPFSPGYSWDVYEITENSGSAFGGETNKKEKELEIDVELLALKLKNADNGSKQKTRSDLTEKLSELFDIKEKSKQREVQHLEKRLQELKESLQQRKQNKNEIVQRRIQEMLGDAKYLKWE